MTTKEKVLKLLVEAKGQAVSGEVLAAECGVSRAAVWKAITNIIPYIGPSIGGIPIVAVAFATDYKLGIIILIIVLAI